ncbi:hypothetical protein CPB85DRAFT_1290273 [Mucidula mucida]|nr:hypothetical protein CPB85DRAFT_1290273 [Mucidula mucida]
MRLIWLLTSVSQKRLSVEVQTNPLIHSNNATSCKVFHCAATKQGASELLNGGISALRPVPLSSHPWNMMHGVVTCCRLALTTSPRPKLVYNNMNFVTN